HRHPHSCPTRRSSDLRNPPQHRPFLRQQRGTVKPPRLAPLPQRLIETLRKPLHRLRPEKRLPVDEERWSTRHSQTERKSKILLRSEEHTSELQSRENL